MNNRMVAEMFPPGDFILEELEERNWSKGDLADIMGRPPQLVSALLKGTRKITLETAKDLAAAFGTSAEFWVNLDTGYRLWKKQTEGSEDDRSAVRSRARVFSIAPVADMVRRQWIPDVRSDADTLEREILKLLEIDSIEQTPMANFATRKSTPNLNYAHIAWFKRARQLAPAVHVSTFTPKKLNTAVTQLKALANNAEDVRHVPTVLAKAGVRFLVVEHISKTKIDGAAFWLSKREPVVVLSMRFGRIDSFWHTLAHELGHISEEDEESLDNELIDGKNAGDLTLQERKADEFACSMLVPQDRLSRFIAKHGRYFSKNNIRGLAKVIGVHPGIIVGQLQYQGAINYSHSREMLVNVRGTITDAALTDGWGKSPPI